MEMRWWRGGMGRSIVWGLKKKLEWRSGEKRCGVIGMVIPEDGVKLGVELGGKMDEMEWRAWGRGDDEGERADGNGARGKSV
ncbi:unnamed protein product [Calypogeia fissa]